MCVHSTLFLTFCILYIVQGPLCSCPRQQYAALVCLISSITQNEFKYTKLDSPNTTGYSDHAEQKFLVIRLILREDTSCFTIGEKDEFIVSGSSGLL